MDNILFNITFIFCFIGISCLENTESPRFSQDPERKKLCDPYRQQYKDCAASFDYIFNHTISYKSNRHIDPKLLCDNLQTFGTCVKNVTLNKEFMDNCSNDHERNVLLVLNDNQEPFIEYLCFNGGERITSLINNGIYECFDLKGDKSKECLQNNGFTYESLNMKKEEDCGILNNTRQCIITELKACPKQDTANIIDGLLSNVIQNSSCGARKAASTSANNPQTIKS